MKTKDALLPIKDDLYDAMIEDAAFGPRRECTLTVHRLVWKGDQGHYEKSPWYVHFGGVENMRELQEFFRRKPHKQSELYTINYAKGEASKAGRLFLKILFERINDPIVVRCQNVSSSSEQPINTTKDTRV
jgi:hypothetical protein